MRPTFLSTAFTSVFIPGKCHEAVIAVSASSALAVTEWEGGGFNWGHWSPDTTHDPHLVDSDLQKFNLYALGF